MAGDFSPLTIEAAHGAPRAVPPALLLAMAVGLGSMDMPVPSVIEWEWLNWKFPRPVHAGDTIYARWTLTQKRPPPAGATSSIVVWRVDLHTADGAMCAEGEVGATVRRQAGGVSHRPAEPRAAAPALPSAGGAPAPAAPTPAAPPQRHSRRRRRPGGNGSAPMAETPVAAASPAPAAAPAAGATKPVERTGSAPRRRRRRRPASASGARDGEGGSPAATAPEPAAARPEPAPSPASTPAEHAKSPLSRVIGRLRRT